MDKNIFGDPLMTCSNDPLTGYFRNGCCDTDNTDYGMHTVCIVATKDFLEFSKEVGNDLSTPVPEFNFDGVITSNTTIEKSNLIFQSKEVLLGGLSGKPLLEKSNELLSLVHSKEPKLLKIGVGGVHSKESFNMKLEKGASLVQIYTSFIYHGPKIIKKLLN